MAEIIVQIARNFRIDPSRCELGGIPYPEQVIETLSVGDELLEPRKVSFDEAFSIDDLTQISETLNRLISDAKRKAKPAEKSKAEKPSRKDETSEGDGDIMADMEADGSEENGCKTGTDTEPTGEDEGDSLF